jgi:hypothetical protein
MVTRKKSVATSNTPPVQLPDGARVIAFVVGIEHYQKRGGPTLPSVDFAHNDANEFADAISGIYQGDQLDIVVNLDSDATLGNLQYGLKQAIQSLGADDLFIFYYAGHGFHDSQGNRITAWDTHAGGLDGTTLSLREILIDPLGRSPCQRALIFIDACATKLNNSIHARDVLTAFDKNELKMFLNSATYCATFLSCEPGQKSYPSNEHQHGLWTYFLLKALRGESEEALGHNRHLTDISLRDYLQVAVRNYVTKSMTVSEVQKPCAFINASNTFSIRYIPEPTITVSDASDLTAIRLVAKKEYLESVKTGSIKSLPGFNRKTHFVPTYKSESATTFIRTLIGDQIDEEIQNYYQSIKSELGLRHKEVDQSCGDGEGSIDTDYFRFSVEVHQHSEDFADYELVRRLILRNGWEAKSKEIDLIFGKMFELVVIEVKPDANDYDELVDMFENLEEQHGGTLEDDEPNTRITYISQDGVRIFIDLFQGRLTLGTGGKMLITELIGKARGYRFGLGGKSQLLLTS